MKSPHELALVLLRKAENDLVAARATLATQRALDTVCFHAQQAAEKSLKALLAARDIAYPLRHDLAELMSEARPLYPQVTALESEVTALSPYAVGMRYDDTLDPSSEVAEAALDTAERVFAMATRLVEEAGA